MCYSPNFFPKNVLFTKFCLWVGVTNSFHVPTHKKLQYKKKKKKNLTLYSLSLSLYTLLLTPFLSLSSEIYFSVHNFETISFYLVENLIKITSLFNPTLCTLFLATTLWQFLHTSFYLFSSKASKQEKHL